LTQKQSRNNQRFPFWLRKIITHLRHHSEVMLRFTDAQMDILSPNPRCPERYAHVTIQKKQCDRDVGIKVNKQTCNHKLNNYPVKSIPEKLNNAKSQIIEAQKVFKQIQFRDALKHLVQARVSLDQFSWIQLEEIKAEDEE